MDNKVISLERAIEKYVKPGMCIHLSLQAGAAASEIARQFWGKRPDFELVMHMIGGHHALGLIHGGLVKKLIFATCADIYPRPLPNPVIQRAYNDKSCVLENWSMLTLIKALMAGALNLPFIPTRSVIGSSLAEDNKHAFRMVDDVFNSGGKVGLVKSIRPDISIVQALASDAQGNMIFPAPPRDAWPAKASKGGVIVCTEKIVGEDVIRRHSMVVKIPGNLVNAVCVVPFGSHPQNMCARGMPEFEGYGLDHGFLKDFRRASEDAGTYSEWIREWILESRSHEEYLTKLGEEKLKSLTTQGVGRPVDKGEILVETQRDEATPSEYAIINGAHIIVDRILEKGYRSMFAGIGISGLAGWCAYYFLKERGYHVDLIAGGIGYEPCPGDPLLISDANMATAKMLSDSLDVHGVNLGGAYSNCLGVLGAGQIDKWGNINSTIIKTKKGREIYLAGAGGGNDISSLAKEVIIVATHRPNRMIDSVNYITCKGDNIKYLATEDGYFKKENGQFILKGYLPKPHCRDPLARSREIAGKCNWVIEASSTLKELTVPGTEELKLLRSFDPENIFLR